MVAKTFGALGVIAGLLAGSFLSMAPAAAAPPPPPNVDRKQAAFMDFLTKQGVPFASPPQAVALAQTTCSILGTSSPTRVQDAVTAIQHSISMSNSQMQTFAGAAITVYCPSVKLS